jgi:protein TorT
LSFNAAGGFHNYEIQRNQLKKCSSAVDGFIIGSTSYSLLENYFKEMAKTKPIVAVGNDIINCGIFAKSISNYGQMGNLLGNEIKNFYSGKRKVNALFLPGPPNDNWVDVNVFAIKKRLKKSQVNIKEILYGELDYATQLKLLESFFYKHKEINLIIANRYAAVKAVEFLKQKGLEDKIQVISTSTDFDVYNLLKKNEILMTAVDSPIRQGRMAVDQMSRILRGKEIIRYVAPVSFVIYGEKGKFKPLLEYENFAANR